MAHAAVVVIGGRWTVLAEGREETPMSGRRPGVVVFMMDQLSARWLEGDNGAAVPTPSFDRLRRMGTTFCNAFTSNPLCMPARSTLATGLTTRGHGVLQDYPHSPREVFSLGAHRERCRRGGTRGWMIG